MQVSRFSLGSVVLGLLAGSALGGCGGGGNGGFSNGSLVTLITPSIDPATTGVAFAQTLQADFPHAPGNFVVTSGALPPGIGLDKRTGLLDGYPRQVGNFQFTIGARDGLDPAIPQGRDSTFAEDQKTYRMSVALGPPHILPQIVPSAQYRASYSYQIDCAGGTQPYTFVQSGGTLPAGISVSPSGVIANFPTQAIEHPYHFQVTVTDALGLTDVESFTLDVAVLPLTIFTAPTLPDAAQGFAYDIPLTLSSAGAGQPIAWSQKTPIAGETLLSAFGMEVANVLGAGRLRVAVGNPGPTVPGTYLFTLRVTDEAGQVAERQFTLKVLSGPVINTVVPNRKSLGAPVVISGLNFMAGAVVIFRPGAGQVQVTPSSITTTTITLNAVPATPAAGGGSVGVKVLNPDGGNYTKPNAYTYPASTLSFSSTAINPTPASALSSTGLDVGDVNKDGFADFVHCGSADTWSNATGSTAGVDLMLNAPSGGVFNPLAPTFTRVQLAASGGGDWYAVRLADVDTDGDLDVVAIGTVSGTVIARVWKNPYPAAFTASVSPQSSTLNSQGGVNGGQFTTPHVPDMVISRLGTDLIPDLAYTQPDVPYSTFSSQSTQSGWNGGRAASMKGNNGTFSGLDVGVNRTMNRLGQAAGVAITDVNGDAHRDVVVSDAYSGWSSQNGFNSGGTSFSEFLWVNTATTSDLFGSWTQQNGGSEDGFCESLCVVAGDVTGDGREDLLVTKGATANATFGGVVQYTNNGGSYIPVNAGQQVVHRYVTVVDGDFDLILDAAATVAPNQVHFFRGRSGTSGLQFVSSVTVTTGNPNVGKLGSGDFDNDGRPDVCVARSFLADAYDPAGSGMNTFDRGVGSTQGVFILLNTSQ